MNAYENDCEVGRLTKELVDSGVRVFQIFQRGSEVEHIDFLLSELRPPHGAKILDVGCGIGEVARLLTLRRPDLQFTLLNISQAQLDLCPVFPQILGSVECIPAPDASFDVVMACYVLGHADQKRSLSEMRRVLRPGGILFVYDIQGGDIPALCYTAHEWGVSLSRDALNTSSFDKVFPDFVRRYPHIKPVLVREIRA